MRQFKRNYVTYETHLLKHLMKQTIKQGTVKTPERHQLQRQWFPGVFIVNVEYISHLVLVFKLLTFSR